jgi:glycine/D-amino acid oxidase-like deaminating enzyme
MKVSRRTAFAAVAGLVAATGAGLGWMLTRRRPPPGTMSGADLARGHRLRDGGFPPPSRTENARVVIAGGGISGLAAGWALAEAGFEDFRLLELEDRIGGNARSGANDVSAFPLGAHYLPVANREARALQQMLRRLGMITGDKDGAPVYDPYQLCADLEERLFWQGRWQEGLVPRTGLTARDRADFAAFDRTMARFSRLTGADGKPAFALPIAYSSQDPALLALDRITFAAWLDGRGWHSPVLRAHLRYCTRDDYGCEPGAVSAWAGIHYFAGRRGWAAEGAGDNVLTWPEGNDHLARAMARRFANRIAPGRIVHHVARDGEQLLIDSFDTAANVSVRTRADAVILATPHFISSRVAPGEVTPSPAFSYAPWLVANVTVDRLPEGKGSPLAWDNVSWASDSLGYVVATHQGPAAIAPASVLTWYMPLSEMAPADARRLLIDRPVEAWQELVEADLLRMNPDLEGAIGRIDIWRWGHAMIRPVPGFIWGAARAATLTRPPLFLAHSDMSGLSLFEEAHYRGTEAAEAAMRHLGHQFESLI